MKSKIIATILILTMLVSYSTMASANVTIPLVSNKTHFGGYTSHSAVMLTTGNVLAQYFTTNKLLKYYSAICPSYGDNVGSLTLSIYQWQGSYASTLQSTAIASNCFTNFKDNQELGVAIPEYTYTGAFLAVFSNPVQQVGVWKSTDGVYSGVTSNIYINGTEYDNQSFEANIKTMEILNVSGVVHNPRDAYSLIQAESYDKKSQNITNNTTSIYVSSANTATAYADVAFGATTPQGINMRVNPYKCSSGDTGEIHVMLDDPEQGTKIAEIYFEYTTQDPTWITIPCNISANVTGTHDVYLVFDGCYYSVDWFQFSTTSVGTSYYNDRLTNFTPVADSSLTQDYSDTWSATDMMGRKLPGYETVGAKDEDKQVGMFYWTWHAQPTLLDTQGVFNNEETLKEYLRTHPGGTEADIKNAWTWDNGAGSWGTGIHMWNQSIYGYYHGLDAWVMRKQMELLSAAGVDALFFDATNSSLTWTGGYMTLGGVLHSMRQSGIKTPQMSFILPFTANDATNMDLRRIYQSMYGTGLYSDTWYYWDGKPVIMGCPDTLGNDTGYSDINALNSTISNFFTFRPAQASYRNGPTRNPMWPWLEVYPQHGFTPLTNNKFDYECVSVGVAQNSNDNGLTAMNGEGVYGRSFTYNDRFSLLSDDSKYYGYNFQEQWSRALELNPKMVFITGWNEWQVTHYTTWQGIAGAFPDQYRDEYSRDIEPTKGDFKDNYYYLMTKYIRQFKGVNQTPVASVEKTINLSNGFSQWSDVGPNFYGYKGGTEVRNYYSMGRQQLYNNNTGRNDIVLSKVARDANNLYFYVKTTNNITPYTDPGWMRLYINTDRTYATGWEGYDFVVNRINPSSSTSATLEYSDNGWNWSNVGAVTYTVNGNEMMIQIPREYLGLDNKLVDIEFKWNDNCQNDGDIMDFYNNGDTAPVGRYAYRYTETTANDTTPQDEPVTVNQIKANEYNQTVIMAVGSSEAFVKGKQTQVDANSQIVPQVINNKTMIPIRFLSEAFNAGVSWNDSTSTASIKKGSKTVEIGVGKNYMTINGTKSALESGAVLINGRVFVPLRDIAVALDKKVYWLDPGLILVGENPASVYNYTWVKDLAQDAYGIR
ncbi:MAG: stalk domain-containing protein [Bacillota bacterium]|nr:stalk domain-containing protein [Bacillota bacterium]